MPAESKFLNAQFLEAPLCSFRRDPPKTEAGLARAISTSTILAEAGSIRRKSDFSVVRTRIARALAISTPVGPAPTRMRKVNRSGVAARIFFGLRLLECLQDFIFGSTRGIREALQPRRVLLKVVTTEIAVRSARGKDEVIGASTGTLFAIRIADEDALSLFSIPHR